MTDSDVDAMYLITSNDNVYRYIPPVLYKREKDYLLAVIHNIYRRNFIKKKSIVCGIYEQRNPCFLIGLVEIFGYDKRKRRVNIGYRFNEDYWNRGYATEVIAALKGYLSVDMEISEITAYVMSENIHSARALEKNGFIKQAQVFTADNWGGRNNVFIDEFSLKLT